MDRIENIQHATIYEISETEAREVRIINEFQKQLPGLKIDDLRFDGRYRFYVRTLCSSKNLIVTYYPGENYFEIRTSNSDWGLLKELSQNKHPL